MRMKRMILSYLDTWRGRMTNRSLQTQLNLSIIILLIVLSVTSFTLIYFGVMDILQEQMEESTVLVFQQVETSIQALQKEMNLVSNRIVLNNNVKRFIESQALSEMEQVHLEIAIKEELNRILHTYTNIHSIFVFFGNGRYIHVGPANTSGSAHLQPNRSFLSTQMYQESVYSFPQMGWIGNVTEYEYSDFDSRQRNVPHLFSAVRGIRSYFHDTQIGTMVINIQERELTSLYDNPSFSTQDQIYIIDSKGSVISHPDESMIGQERLFLEEIDSKKRFGNFTLQEEPSPRQVVYYDLQNPNWYLIKEVPLTEIADNILDLRRILIVVLLISIIVSLLISAYFIRRVTKPIHHLTQAMTDVGRGDIGKLVATKEKNELDVLRTGFNNMSKSIEELMEKNKKIEEEKRKTEVESLQAQINPHFLYNTLNNIKWMAILSNSTNVADSITSLGKFLKPIFSNSNILVPLREEVQYTENYFNLINKRFGEGIRIRFDIDDQIRDDLTLRFVLQPLVENACIHGFKSLNYIGKIHVSAKEDDGSIIIMVTDDGVGVTQERLIEIQKSLNGDLEQGKKNRIGIGLRNIHQRIKLHFGNQYGLDIRSLRDSGTTIMLYIPKIKKS